MLTTRPPRPGLESNNPSLYETQGDSQPKRVLSWWFVGCLRDLPYRLLTLVVLRAGHAVGSAAPLEEASFARWNEGENIRHPFDVASSNTSTDVRRGSERSGLRL